MTRVAISFAWPPSVNHYWRSLVFNRRGKGGTGKKKLRAAVIISEEGHSYRKHVADQVTAARISQRCVAGKLAVEIAAYPPDMRARDLDNLLKAMLDALKHAGVYRDDSDIDDLRIVRKQVRKGGEMIVTISEIAGAATTSRELFEATA